MYTCGSVCHVLNRSVGRATIFHDAADYAAFEDLLLSAGVLTSVRLLTFCLMPNHWHLVLWPQADGDLSGFMHRLTMTHTMRWHHAHGTLGTGPLYQGRFKSFPVESGVIGSRPQLAPPVGPLGSIMWGWRTNRLTKRLFHDCGPASATMRRGRPRSFASVA